MADLLNLVYLGMDSVNLMFLVNLAILVNPVDLVNLVDLINVVYLVIWVNRMDMVIW